jgi:membrane protein
LDTPYDVEAAAKCGVAAVALRSGGFTDERFAAAAAIETDIDVLFSQRALGPR